MGERAFQVTRILQQDTAWAPLSKTGPLSTVVYGAKDADDARATGAEMLGCKPNEVTVEEFQATGLTMAEAIKQAEAFDASAESGKQMADWLRNG